MRASKTIAFGLLLSLGVGAARAQEHGGGILPERQSWSFAGPLGSFDKGQLQRGFKVYKEVCSNCHSLNYVAFRNLAEAGGPGFSASQVKALAATYKVKDGPNDSGDMFERPGLPSDRIPWNFANVATARAALGAVPPDMSTLAKARSYERGFPWFLADLFTQYEERGVDYIVALLAEGYREPAKDSEPLPAGVYYNAVIPGHKIAMASPLDLIFDASGKPSDPQFYSDGAPLTRQQVAKDVAAFLMWAAEPKLEERKLTGFRVMIFLILFASLLYLVKRRIWAGLHAHAA